jgi:phage portal protein BeeE
MTAFDFKFLMMSNQLLYGAGIAEIEFKQGFPVSLYPIHPNKVMSVNTIWKEIGEALLYYSRISC